MSNKGKGGAAALTLVGAIAGAGSKWYLVWLAQLAGGTEYLGEYGLLFAVATPIFVVAQLGLRTIFLSSPQAYPWRSYLILRAAGLIVGSAALGMFVLLSPRVGLWLGMSVLMMKVADSFLDIEIARVQYSNRMRTVGVITIFGAALSVLLSTIAILATHSLTAAVIGATTATFIAYFVAKYVGARTSYAADFPKSGKTEILKASAPITAAQLFGSLLLYLPTLYLGAAADLGAVGLYVGAAYLLTVADLIGASVAKLLITPLRRRRAAEGDRAVTAAVNAWARRALMLGIPVLALIVPVGPAAFRLVYGDSFNLPVSIMAALGGAALAIVVSHLQSVALNVLNRYYAVLTSFAAACVLSVLLALALSLIGSDALLTGALMAAAGALVRCIWLSVGVANHARRGTSQGDVAAD